MGYNWTIKISLSSQLRLPQPAASWGRLQPAATETASQPTQPGWVLGKGAWSRDSTDRGDKEPNSAQETSVSHSKALCKGRVLSLHGS